MASLKIQTSRGTADLLPDQQAARRTLMGLADQQFRLAGYGRIDTPIFEDTALFARGIGSSTEIVQKEMYTFEDQGDRSLTLRPEGTASICRAYVEHGMHKLPTPVKLWYEGPFFRQEAPQAGRFRQFSQIGCEALGSDHPALDAESIALLAALLDSAGVGEYRLRIASLGSSEARTEYADELRGYLRANESRLSDDVRNRIDLNPLRAFDAKHEGTVAVMQAAPKLMDALSDQDREHFNRVLALLDGAGIGYEVDPTLVRGLDYYTRTVFEFTSDKLGAQSGLGGGGRYDGLVEMLGGPPTPAVGWAAGVERILLAAGSGATADQPDAASVFVALDDGADAAAAFRLVCDLRANNMASETDVVGRSLNSQIKQAVKSKARFVVTVRDGDSWLLRDLRGASEEEVEPASIVALLSRRADTT